jgi:hypothetical protein
MAGNNLRLRHDWIHVPLKVVVPWRQQMKKTLLISGMLLALAASTAMAGGVNLAWQECLGGGGLQNRNFACSSNTGTANILVVSYVADVAVPDMVATDVRIDLQSNDAVTLNPWWQFFNAGACQSTKPTVDVAGFVGGCVDAWANVAAGGGGIGSYTVTGNKAALLMTWASPEGQAVDNTTEYYSMNVRISNARTVGSPSCAGCPTPVCLVANVVALAHGAQGAESQTIDHPTVAGSNVATWQGGGIAAPGCPAAVPTRAESWGRVKAMYR